MYIDSFVVPVPKQRLGEYRRFARTFDALWIQHGALEIHEYVADDVKAGRWTSFPRAVKAKANELVVVAWIVYRSRSHRNAVTKRVLADPLLANPDPKKIPFDGKRMFWGGFKELLRLPKTT